MKRDFFGEDEHMVTVANPNIFSRKFEFHVYLFAVTVLLELDQSEHFVLPSLCAPFRLVSVVFTTVPLVNHVDLVNHDHFVYLFQFDSSSYKIHNIFNSIPNFMKFFASCPV